MIPVKANRLRRFKERHVDGNRWVCMECKAELGPSKVEKCPTCGSGEVENVG